MIRPMHLCRSVATAVTAVMLVLPGTALAGSIYNDGSSPEFEGLDGEANRLFVSSTSGVSGGSDTVTFFDSAAPITIVDDVPGDCSQPNANTVTCVGDYFAWDAELGDENDEATAAGSLSGEFEGDEGNDILRGSDDGASFDDLNGDEGDDQIFGNGGDDSIDGGSGTDLVQAGAGDDEIVDFSTGNDTYDGGPGVDEIAFLSRSFPPDAPDNFVVDLNAGTARRTNNLPETDSVTGIEDGVIASITLLGFGQEEIGGNDELIGSPVTNVLLSGAGNDRLDGRDGADRLVAGSGDDQIEARDGATDQVICGEGNDVAQVDQFDVVSGCESTTVEQRRAAGADVVAPDCRVRNVKRSYGRGAFFKGFTARLICDEAATLSVQLLTTVRSGQVGGSKVGDLVLAQRTARSAGGSAVTRIKVKPGRKFAKRLTRRKGLKVRLQVDATDQYGNRDRNVKRVKVAKPKKRKKGRKRR